MFSSFLINNSPISPRIANLKYPVDKVGTIYANPALPRLLTISTLPQLLTIRNVRMQVFFGYGGFKEDDEIWKKRVLLNVARNKEFLEKYAAAKKIYDDALDALVEKEIDVEEDEKWFRILLEDYIKAVLPSILMPGEKSGTKIDNNKIGKLVSKDENITLLIDATEAYKKLKLAKTELMELQEVHSEALRNMVFLRDTYNKEIAEAAQYVSNENYFFIEWMLKSVHDVDEIN